MNSFISSFNGTELPVVASGDAPSKLTGDFSVAFLSPSLLSLRFTVETSITGAAHPSTQAGSINFNVASGAVIQFPDLFTSPAAALPVLQTQAHTKLTALLGADLAWPASVTMADFGGAWAFTPAGLELTWSQGDIASMASGTPTISIAWSALKTVIAKPGPAAGFVP
ncbi:MAG: RsiV family protein [Candidatus Limnocylindrales bacterium]